MMLHVAESVKTLWKVTGFSKRCLMRADCRTQKDQYHKVRCFPKQKRAAELNRIVKVGRKYYMMKISKQDQPLKIGGV